MIPWKVFNDFNLTASSIAFEICDCVYMDLTFPILSRNLVVIIFGFLIPVYKMNTSIHGF